MNTAGELDEIELRAAASILALHCQHLERENAEIKDLAHALAGVLWRLEKNGYIRDLEYGDEETAGELAHLMSVGMKAVDDARAKLGQPKRYDGMALGSGVVESRDSVQIGQTGSAQAKPENSDADSVCRDIAPPTNDSPRIVQELRSAISDGAADWKLGELTRSLLSA